MEKETRLGFLRVFIKYSLHLSLSKFARRIGKSENTVYSWFKEDDIKLSTLEASLQEFGYRFDFHYLSRDADSSLLTNELVRSRGQLFRPQRLYPLREAIDRSGLNFQQITETTGYPYSTMYHWFVVDDLRLSALHTIGKAIHLDLQVTISSFSEDTPDYAVYSSVFPYSSLPRSEKKQTK